MKIQDIFETSAEHIDRQIASAQFSVHWTSQMIIEAMNLYGEQSITFGHITSDGDIYVGYYGWIAHHFGVYTEQQHSLIDIITIPLSEYATAELTGHYYTDIVLGIYRDCSDFKQVYPKISTLAARLETLLRNIKRLKLTKTQSQKSASQIS